MISMKNFEKTITLLLTNSCNLNCIYCYEHNKAPESMSFETAKEILDNELIGRDMEVPVIIDLFGGEPFLNFELMKRIVDYVCHEYGTDGIHFFTTTNGTLVHGEVQKWLKAHKAIFTCGISLDGTERAHNINRSNSFSKIDIDFFLNTYPKQGVKMTISKESLPYLSESVIFLTELGFEVGCNCAEGIDWSDGKCGEILGEQLNLLIDYYLDHPAAKKCSMLDAKIGILSHPNPSFHRNCGSGRYMHCYDAYGECYPCQLFAPLSVGKKAIKLKDADLSDEVPIEKLDKRCAHCYYLPICPRCEGANYASTGSRFSISDVECLHRRIIFAANAKLKALEWERGVLKLNECEEQALIRSILKIQTIDCESLNYEGNNDEI